MTNQNQNHFSTWVAGHTRNANDQVCEGKNRPCATRRCRPETVQLFPFAIISPEATECGSNAALHTARYAYGEIDREEYFRRKADLDDED